MRVLAFRKRLLKFILERRENKMEVTSSLFNSLFTLSLILIFCFVIYLVIKRAVKKGILEAYDEINEKKIESITSSK